MTDTTINKRVMAARTMLVLDQPFFGVLALRLILKEDPGCGTAWVDGKTIGYDPAFFATLSQKEIMAVLCHEVMHCAAGHPWRRDGRNAWRWNVACDRAINPVLREAAFSLPASALMELDPSHHGKSAEWIFARLPVDDKPEAGEPEAGEQDEDEQTQPEPDEADDDEADDESGDEVDDDADTDGQAAPRSSSAPAPCQDPLGEVRDAPPESDTAEATEEAWQQATQQAALAAQSQGALPGGLARFAAKTVAPRVDWRSALRRFMQERAQADYSWIRPNPRHVVRGMYLPGLRSDEMGAVVVAIDTSGSVDGVLLSQFGAELQSIVDELQPRQVHVLYCDAAINRVDVYERGDTITITPCGGGGTDFRPAFGYLATMDEPPVALVYLTDLLGSFPRQAPDVPVLWAVPEGYNANAPFGEAVTV